MGGILLNFAFGGLYAHEPDFDVSLTFAKVYSSCDN